MLSGLVGLGVSVVGMGMQWGAIKNEVEDAKAAQNAEAGVIGTEQEINQQRQQQMKLEYNRYQMQQIRNLQLQRAMAITSATAQGANFGSGLPGGEAQGSGQVANNLRNATQNFEIGNKIFSLEDTMAMYRLQEVTAKTDMEKDKAQQELGGMVSSLGGPLGKLAGTFGGFLGIG